MASPVYEFKAVPAFWKAFRALTPDQQKLARKKFKTFEANPFDPSLKPHKINRLSSLYRQTIHSVTVDGDLKAVFCTVGNQIVSLDIGTHDIYK